MNCIVELSSNLVVPMESAIWDEWHFRLFPNGLRRSSQRGCGEIGCAGLAFLTQEVALSARLS